MSTDIEKEAVGQVTQEVNRQSNQANELREVLEKLEARLTDVRTGASTGVEVELASDSKKPPLVPLAIQIADSNDITAQCLRELGSLLNRLEI